MSNEIIMHRCPECQTVYYSSFDWCDEGECCVCCCEHCQEEEEQAATEKWLKEIRWIDE